MINQAITGEPNRSLIDLDGIQLIERKFQDK